MWELSDSIVLHHFHFFSLFHLFSKFNQLYANVPPVLSRRNVLPTVVVLLRYVIVAWRIVSVSCASRIDDAIKTSVSTSPC